MGGDNGDNDDNDDGGDDDAEHGDDGADGVVHGRVEPRHWPVHDAWLPRGYAAAAAAAADVPWRSSGSARP